jgi:cyclophilin family peptidyl-prolyl cis-trans isomerase
MKTSVLAGLLLFVPLAAPAAAQVSRLAILQAEDRRAPTPRDLAVIRGGLHADNAETARTAVRALGRLERPALVPDILPLLKSGFPEVRAEAADAVAQALQGPLKPDRAPSSILAPASTALAARLAVEAEASVRASIRAAIGRLPYASAAEVAAAERAIVTGDIATMTAVDRLGVAQGLFSLARLRRKLQPPSDEARAALLELARLRAGEAVSGARVRRLAVETLLTASMVDAALVRTAAADPDAQVRRLAMRAAASADLADAGWPILTRALTDDSAMVRLEAVHGIGGADRPDRCALLVGALKDRDTHVDLGALDALARCGASDEAVQALVRTADDLSEAGSPRGWHRGAHAIVALAAASPDRASGALGQFTASDVWQLRMYAARAATALKDRKTLERLAADANDNVVEAAIDALSAAAGHDDDAMYVKALARPGYQAVRAAARALRHASSADQAVPALQQALARLRAEDRDNGHDARDAVAEALESLGARVPASKPRSIVSDLDGEDLRRLAAPRARIAIRGVGTFELALFPAEAPATVIRFATLAERGYYNGLTFHRVVPNFVVQGGSPGANEYIGDASFMRDELGLWPHVRGAVGISTRGRDTGDGQLFVDLVDNPRLDHEYTVFAQVLNGIDVVDRILEGDVIERVDIVVGP